MTESRWLWLAGVAAVCLVAAALFMDEQREFESAVESVTDEQVTLAHALGADVEERLQALERASGHALEVTPQRITQLLGGAVTLAQPGVRALVVSPPGHAQLLMSDGHRVHAPTLEAALRRRLTHVLLPREESPQLALPERIGIAGIRVAHGHHGDWGVAVVVSAQRLRNRERHAQLRVLLGVGVVTLIVSAFGLLAARQARRKLEVARALEQSAFERERERLLAKADKMATLAALSSGIAHEVATPLGTIMARIEQVLPANAHDPRASTALRVALEQVERIQTIIRGVLGLARGELPPLVQAAPAQVAEAAVERSLHRFDAAGVHIALRLDDTLPIISCDPPMLEQALINLLLNACDASARGQTVTMSVRALPDALGFIVDDDGEGISVETAQRAQEAFFTTKPTGLGSGLGLAITREIVAHHGGQLKLESRAPERGTRARIELPRV